MAFLHVLPYPHKTAKPEGFSSDLGLLKTPWKSQDQQCLGAGNEWSSSCVRWQRVSHLSLLVAPCIGSGSPGAVVQLQPSMSNRDPHTFSVPSLPNVAAFECALAAFKKSKVVQLLDLLIIRVCIQTHWSYRLAAPFGRSSACTFVI